MINKYIHLKLLKVTNFRQNNFTSFQADHNYINAMSTAELYSESKISFLINVNSVTVTNDNFPTNTVCIYYNKSNLKTSE